MDLRGISRSALSKSVIPRNLTLEAKSLLLVLSALAALSAFRAYDYWVTGFFVSDEYGYVTSALQGTSAVPDRWFFAWMNIAIFRAFGINSIDAYAFFLPFYLFFWSGLTLVMVFLVLRLLGLSGRAIALTLLSSIFLVAFSLLSLGFLTETPGLALAMVGVYFILRYTKAKTIRGRAILALLSALFFSAATGTRQPYVVFSVGGIFIVLLAELRLSDTAYRRNWFHVAIPTMLFAVPAIFFLQYPTGLLLNTLVPLGSSFANSLSQLFAVGGAHKSVVVANGSLTSPSVLSAATPGRLPETAGVFLLGLGLGWTPILFFVGAGGTLFLAWAMMRGRSLERDVVLALSILAFTSYLGVCYLVSWDPSYLTFLHYSTVIRFSNTALPAFFLSAPFFFSRFVNTRRRVLVVFGILVLFSVVSLSSYEAYAASNLGYANANPFLLSYRTPAAQVRDYLLTQQGTGQSVVMGVPGGWSLTPGVQDLRAEVVPYLNQTQFIQQRWTRFYLYVPSNTAPLSSEYPYLGDILNGTQLGNVSYSVADTLVVTQGTGFSLVRVDLVWNP